MRRLDFYVSARLLKLLLTAELIGFALAFIIEFFERLDTFTRSFEALCFGLLSVLYKSPYFLNLFLPLSFLISILVLFMLMARRNEVIALRASGISTFSLLRPALILSISLALLSFIAEEFFIPMALKKSEYTYRVRVKKEEPNVFIKNDRIWLKKGNLIANIDLFDPRTDKMLGVTLIEIGPDFSVRKRIDARQATWEAYRWRFVDVVEREFKNGEVSKRVIKERFGLSEAPPSVFKIVRRGPEEMGFRELKRYIGKLKEGNYDTGRYLVDLYNKISFPLINPIMVLLGASLGLRYRRTTHISLGIFLGLCVGLLYWSVHSFSIALGHAQIFPPLFSSFFSSLLSSILGTIGILTLRR